MDKYDDRQKQRERSLEVACAFTNALEFVKAQHNTSFSFEDIEKLTWNILKAKEKLVNKLAKEAMPSDEPIKSSYYTNPGLLGPK